MGIAEYLAHREVPVVPVILSIDEKEIVARAQRGDMESLGAIYTLHKGQVNGVILRIVANPSIAEDLTQEVFVRVLNSISRFHHESALGTWLHEIAVNVALTYRDRSTRVPIDSSVDIEGFSDCGRQARHLEVLDEVSHLENAIASLPEAERTSIILHYKYGYSYAEVAERRGVTPGAVGSACFRGTEKLLKEREQWYAPK